MSANPLPVVTVGDALRGLNHTLALAYSDFINDGEKVDTRLMKLEWWLREMFKVVVMQSHDSATLRTIGARLRNLAADDDLVVFLAYDDAEVSFVRMAVILNMLAELNVGRINVPSGRGAARSVPADDAPPSFITDLCTTLNDARYCIERIMGMDDQ